MSKHYDASLARGVAEKLIDAVRDSCERIEIAGSLRRKRAMVHDIDLVVIPKLIEQPRTNPTFFDDTELVPALLIRLNELFDRRKIDEFTRGEKIYKCFATATGIPIDIYLATTVTWPTILLIRTGSKHFNIRMCQHARELDYQLHADGRGLEDGDGKLLPITSEHDIFAALNLPYIEPEAREACALERGK